MQIKFINTIKAFVLFISPNTCLLCKTSNYYFYIDFNGPKNQNCTDFVCSNTEKLYYLTRKRSTP